MSRDRWAIAGEEATGWYGWQATDEASMLWLLCDGVLVEAIPLGGRGEIAILDAPFRLDIGEAKIVRDEQFERRLALVEALRREHPRPSRPTPAPAPAAPTKSAPPTVFALSKSEGVWERLVAMLPIMLFCAALGECSSDLDEDEFVPLLVFGLVLSWALGLWLVALIKAKLRG